MVVQAVLAVIRVWQALVVRLGQVGHVARVVPTVRQSRLVATVAMVVTGMTRALISARRLERRVVTAGTAVWLAVWVTAVRAVTAVTVRSVRTDLTE